MDAEHAASPDETVGALGEKAVLARVLAALHGSSRALVGPGDDAAVLSAPGGRVVVSTDTLVHGPDFRLAWSSGYDLGWKAAAVNLADIAAMGAAPTALFVALALPDATSVSFVADLARGLREACDALAPGCGVCTTKCEFDAIRLHRDLPECSKMVRSEDKFKAILPYMAKREIKIRFAKKEK